MSVILVARHHSSYQWNLFRGLFKRRFVVVDGIFLGDPRRARFPQEPSDFIR